MNREIVRSLCWAAGCCLLFILLGFAPLWLTAATEWSASSVAKAAMPVGESAPSAVSGPLKTAKTPTVFGDPAMHP